MLRFLIQEGYQDREKAQVTGEANRIVRDLNAVLVTNNDYIAKAETENLVEKKNNEENSSEVRTSYGTP